MEEGGKGAGKGETEWGAVAWRGAAAVAARNARPPTVTQPHSSPAKQAVSKLDSVALQNNGQAATHSVPLLPHVGSEPGVDGSLHQVVQLQL